ncbi:MAG: hypothetical protein K1X51_01000 [Rhodospirillaceae bacterium]|nr:hypothetical protein [Rhodospirillaceae bacterium]
MTKSIAKILVPAFVALVFHAASAAEAPLRFADATMFSTDAVALSINIEARPPKEYPHVMYRAPFTFEQAVKAWAAARFNLSGNSVNTLRVTLKEGDITEKLLPKTGGIKGWFTKDQAAEYDARLAVEVAVIDPNGKSVASAEGKSWQTQTVTEGATEDDKRKVWADMIKATFDNMDAELLPRMRSTMSGYLH